MKGSGVTQGCHLSFQRGRTVIIWHTRLLGELQGKALFSFKTKIKNFPAAVKGEHNPSHSTLVSLLKQDVNSSVTCSRVLTSVGKHR